jgi:hypothetical protein
VTLVVTSLQPRPEVELRSFTGRGLTFLHENNPLPRAEGSNEELSPPAVAGQSGYCECVSRGYR